MTVNVRILDFRIGGDVTVTVNIPALDSLVDYLRGSQQSEIDTLAASVKHSTDRLRQSQQALQSAVEGME
jgi:hypothetical protein